MPTCFTSLSRIGASIGLAALALVALDAAAQPRGAACPTRAGGKPLSALDVFDGPPSELASLKPEIRHDGRTSWVSTWDVRYIYRAGRRVYLRCEYDTKSIVVPVSRAKACRSVERGGVRSLSCA